MPSHPNPQSFLCFHIAHLLVLHILPLCTISPLEAVEKFKGLGTQNYHNCYDTTRKWQNRPNGNSVMNWQSIAMKSGTPYKVHAWESDTFYKCGMATGNRNNSWLFSHCIEVHEVATWQLYNGGPQIDMIQTQMQHNWTTYYLSCFSAQHGLDSKVTCFTSYETLRIIVVI